MKIVEKNQSLLAFLTTLTAFTSGLRINTHVFFSCSMGILLGLSLSQFLNFSQIEVEVYYNREIVI